MSSPKAEVMHEMTVANACSSNIPIHLCGFSVLIEQSAEPQGPEKERRRKPLKLGIGRLGKPSDPLEVS
eukprot:1809543-Amphidinium_carterae.1